MVMVVIMMISVPIIPVPIVIPAVLVLDPAPAALPITWIIFATLIARGKPGCSRIWRARPIALMPFPVVSYRIPVAVNPHIIRSRSSRKYTDRTWRWRWTDSDSKRNLAKDLSRGQECNTEQNCSKKPLHVFRPPDLLGANTLPNIKDLLTQSFQRLEVVWALLLVHGRHWNTGNFSEGATMLFLAHVTLSHAAAPIIVYSGSCQRPDRNGCGSFVV